MLMGQLLGSSPGGPRCPTMPFRPQGQPRAPPEQWMGSRACPGQGFSVVFPTSVRTAHARERDATLSPGRPGVLEAFETGSYSGGDRPPRPTCPPSGVENPSIFPCLSVPASCRAPSCRLQRSSPVPVAILALALGTFGIGTTEFVIMGMLPHVARDIVVD